MLLQKAASDMWLAFDRQLALKALCSGHTVD
jgi:hypothetical protein